MRMRSLPLLHGLDGRLATQSGLRQLMVVEADVAQQGLLKIVTAVEAMRAQHVADTAIEALHPAVGLRSAGPGQAMLDVQGLAEPIVEPARVIRGEATHLGNPADLQLMADGTLIVAEKAHGGGERLEFGGFSSAADGNLAPTRAVAIEQLETSGTPESLAILEP